MSQSPVKPMSAETGTQVFYIDDDGHLAMRIDPSGEEGTFMFESDEARLAVVERLRAKGPVPQ